MGCTSAKQVSAVPNDEEGRGKAYSNGDLFTDEYKMKGVEEVKYMRGDENRVNARNQENLQETVAKSMEATAHARRRAMCSTGANPRKRSLQQTSSLIFTRQRASRNSSGCWMRRSRRGETTVQRGRRKTGHSTEAPPRFTPAGSLTTCVCLGVSAYVCAHVCLREKTVESVFYHVTGHCACWYEHVCDFERMAKIVF